MVLLEGLVEIRPGAKEIRKDDSLYEKHLCLIHKKGCMHYLCKKEFVTSCVEVGSPPKMN